MIFRQGRHNKELIYLQIEDGPRDEDQLYLVCIQGPHTAEKIVEWLNRGLENV